ncbi:hypothetical protein BJ170DRAFT_176035 [Xylariales sp. AK1849]|nr:hypothetical protein BJ170DRAFT_176035 [Xylariales sp. AK1849]
MALRTNSRHVLPRDLIELQLAQIDLLMAMYPVEGAFVIDEASTRVLEAFRDSCASGQVEISPGLPYGVSLLLALEVEEEVAAVPKSLQLDINVPFSYNSDDNTTPNEPPHPRIRLRQPSWMSKAEVAQLTADIPEDEDLFATIEHIKDAASLRMSLTRMSMTTRSVPGDSAPIIRVWFYFPSISTRSKRDDLIIHAPIYGLTGFLLAGKPGILCLEGTSQSVDDYMKFIRTESWGDIPAHHKKVSERFRQTETGLRRVFDGMQEITDTIGDRRGERANRSDMKALEAFLAEKGLAEAFTKVLI